MKRTQIYLEEEQYDYLMAESRNRGVSIANIIRELINKSISSRQKKSMKKSFWNGGEDGFSTGISNGSISHDEAIYKSKLSDNED